MFENNKTKLVIFDWSGVVKDAVTAHLWVINRIFSHKGLPEISLETFYANWSEPYMRFFNKYLPEMTLEQEQEMYRAAVREADYPKSKCVEGMKDLLEELRRKDDRLAVVSSDLKDTLMKEIESYGLNNIFEKIYFEASDKRIAVKEMLEIYPKEEAVIVGDSIHEIEVAKELSIKSVAVTWGLGNKKSLLRCQPDMVADNVQELKKYLLIQ